MNTKKNNFIPPQRIAIYGLGKSSVSAIKLLNDLGRTDFWVINQGNPKDWQLGPSLKYDSSLFLSESDESKKLLSSMDLVIISPGIPRSHPNLELAIKNGVKIWTEIELGYHFKESDETIIGITGTNGKTTTVSLLEQMIKDSGARVFLAGNVGIPYCDYILKKRNKPEEKVEYIILELSSS